MKSNDWEVVDSGSGLYRIEVPGGWLYHYSDYAKGLITFVPRPESIDCPR